MYEYKFGKYIFKLRTEQGLSRAKLAEKLGVFDKAISKYGKGKAKPRVEIPKKVDGLPSAPF